MANCGSSGRTRACSKKSRKPKLGHPAHAPCGVFAIKRIKDRMASTSPVRRRNASRSRSGNAMKEISPPLVAERNLFEVLLVESRLEIEDQHVVEVRNILPLRVYITAGGVTGMESAQPALKFVTAECVLMRIVFPELELNVLDFLVSYHVRHVEQFAQRSERHVLVVVNIDDDFDVGLQAAHLGHAGAVFGGLECNHDFDRIEYISVDVASAPIR